MVFHALVELFQKLKKLLVGIDDFLGIAPDVYEATEIFRWSINEGSLVVLTCGGWRLGLVASGSAGGKMRQCQVPKCMILVTLG